MSDHRNEVSTSSPSVLWQRGKRLAHMYPGRHIIAAWGMCNASGDATCMSCCSISVDTYAIYLSHCIEGCTWFECIAGSLALWHLSLAVWSFVCTSVVQRSSSWQYNIVCSLMKQCWNLLWQLLACTCCCYWGSDTACPFTVGACLPKTRRPTDRAGDYRPVTASGGASGSSW